MHGLYSWIKIKNFFDILNEEEKENLKHILCKIILFNDLNTFYIWIRYFSKILIYFSMEAILLKL